MHKSILLQTIVVCVLVVFISFFRRIVFLFDWCRRYCCFIPIYCWSVYTHLACICNSLYSIIDIINSSVLQQRHKNPPEKHIMPKSPSGQTPCIYIYRGYHVTCRLRRHPFIPPFSNIDRKKTRTTPAITKQAKIVNENEMRKSVA